MATEFMDDTLEIDDSNLVDNPSVLRIGYSEGDNGATFAYIEIESPSGKINRFWMDGAAVEEAIGGLVDVIPHII